MGAVCTCPRGLLCGPLFGTECSPTLAPKRCPAARGLNEGVGVAGRSPGIPCEAVEIQPPPRQGRGPRAGTRDTKLPLSVPHRGRLGAQGRPSPGRSVGLALSLSVPWAQCSQGSGRGFGPEANLLALRHPGQHPFLVPRTVWDPWPPCSRTRPEASVSAVPESAPAAPPPSGRALAPAQRGVHSQAQL